MLCGLEKEWLAGPGVMRWWGWGKLASVVSGVNCLELRNAFCVGLLEAAESSVVEVAGVARITVSPGDDAAVHTGRVAVPDIQVNARNGLAGPGVDDLEVESHGHPCRAVGDVATYQLAADIIGPFCRLGLEYTGGVVGEEIFWICLEGDVGVL